MRKPGVVVSLVISALTLLVGCGKTPGEAETSPATHTPTAFAQLDLDAARDRAAAEGKLLLVDTTACWCVPCRKMDRVTWADEQVIAWLNEHAIAVQLDRDQDSQACQALGLDKCPTPSVVVYRDGVEFDRVCGYQSAPELLAWLDGVQQGETHIDRLRALAGDRDAPPEEIDILAHLRLAQAFVQIDRLDQATDEYLWLWHNMLHHDPSLAPLRYDAIAGDLIELAKHHPPAATALRDLRDAIVPACSDDPTVITDTGDWIVLNKILDDDEATLQWFDAIRHDKAAGPVLSTHSDQLLDLLVRERRWADAGRIDENPAAVAESILDEAAAPLPDDDTSPDQHRRRSDQRLQQCIELVSIRYAACLAANRDRPAAELASLLLARHDCTATRLALIKHAYLARAPRPAHLDWLQNHMHDLDEAQCHGWRQRIERLLAELDQSTSGSSPRDAAGRQNAES